MLPGPGNLLHWGKGGLEPSEDQGSLLPLVTYIDILCNICIWSHGSHQVYSLVGGLIPGSSGVTGWFILLFLLGAANPSAPWVLPLALLLGTLCSVQWLAKSIHFYIFQALAEPLRRQLYWAPVSKHLLASIIASAFHNYMRWIPRCDSHWMIFPSVSAPNFVSVSPSIGI